MGALYIRRSPRPALLAQMHGGGHERGYRSGTLATHQIVGIGTAAALAAEELVAEGARLEAQRDALWEQLSRSEGVTLNGHRWARLPGALNVSVAGVEGEALLLSLSDFALSTGSACTSASLEPSYVLRAMGLPDALAHSSLRISLGRFTSDGDLERFASRFAEVVPRLRREDAS
jgi:cysteine desulfurase